MKSAENATPNAPDGKVLGAPDGLHSTEPTADAVGIVGDGNCICRIMPVKVLMPNRAEDKAMDTRTGPVAGYVKAICARTESGKRITATQTESQEKHRQKHTEENER